MQDQHEGQHLGQLAEGDGPGQDLCAADPQRRGHGQEIDEGHLGGRQHEEADAPAGGFQSGGRHLVEFGHLVILGGESAHHAYPAQIFFHDLGQRRHPVLQGQPSGEQFQSREGGAHADNRHKGEGHQTQDRVDTQQHEGAAADENTEVEHAQDAGVGPQAHALDIEDTASHQIAGVDAVMPR